MGRSAWEHPNPIRWKGPRHNTVRVGVAGHKKAAVRQVADLCPMMELRLPPIRDLNLHDDVRQPAHPAPSQGPVVRDERLQKVGPLYHRPDHPTYFAQVLSHCQALCAFADHYATAPPPPQSPEVTQMVDRAVEVINILKEYKEAHCPPSAPPRPPKRPWEDPTDDIVTQRPAPSPPTDRVPSPITAPASPTNVVPPAQEGQPERKSTVEDDAKAAAIRDMEDIRARRNQVQANASGKVKYKKRSNGVVALMANAPFAMLAVFVGSSQTPSSALSHSFPRSTDYAKLVRKRDRIISSLPAGGEAPPPIDIAFLRKSARMAAENSALARSSAGRRRTTEKDKAKTDSPAASSSKPPSTSTDEGRRTWERHEKESGPIKQYRHSTVASPTFSAPPLSSPTRPLTLMPMTLPPPPQTRYPAPGQPPVTYGPSFQPYIQSGPASQPSYHMGPPGSSWSYDHGHPHYPPGSAQWGDRSISALSTIPQIYIRTPSSSESLTLHPEQYHPIDCRLHQPGACVDPNLPCPFRPMRFPVLIAVVDTHQNVAALQSIIDDSTPNPNPSPDPTRSDPTHPTHARSAVPIPHSP
ncbi:hypothetical protein AG1IA_09372 [Rhizoctonia solani AG-1 IA]|uniref:Uncharacterized protein n=1 Tax=Thanatephorus cucumeris (strain AG1-IA) TaxID=983506 RepID=L8WIG4_THACA|nr:hypothetical protein AG1IA_09372 [Rhizoctonia solani AG-1 IA]